MTVLKKNKQSKIRQYYRPNKKEEELLGYVYDRYYNMKDNPQRQEAEEEWDKGEKAWDQFSKESEDLEEWQANYYVPMTTAVVESILSEMVDQSPRPIILPRASEDKPKATVMRHVFDYTWDVANGDVELEAVLKDALIYGDGFAQEFYWEDKRMVKKLKEMTKNKKKQKIGIYDEYEKMDYDDCYMESVSPYELFFDPTARSINQGPRKARDAIRRQVMKLEDAKIFFSGEIWDPLNNMRYVRPGANTDFYSFFKPPEDVDKSDEVEVLWYWSRQPEDWLMVVINDVLIMAKPNPYKHKQLPFAKASDVKRPHKFYHKGEPKLLEAVQKELNTLRRMVTDRNHLDIDKMWLVSRSETFSEEDTITRPGGIIRVDDPANYKPMEYRDVPRSVQYTIDQLQKDSIRVTGVEERFQSVKTPGTATEAAILKESTVRRIKMKLKSLEKGFLVDIGRMRIANIMQFYSQPKLEKIVGEVGTEQYKKAIARARKKGLLTTIDGKPYQERYREIRLKGKELTFDERGGLIERPAVGFTFFELKPEFFMPVAQGGYDIKFEAGATMPVSKSLLAKQTQDAVSMLMPLATANIGYDPVKLGDDLLKSLDKDPEDYKIEDEQRDMAKAREELAVNLASRENEEVMNGQPIPEMGTPYATPSHTMVHIAFLKSEVAKQAPQDRYMTLAKHAMGEITAQTMRGETAGLTGEQSQQAGPQPQPGQTSPHGYNVEKKAAIPALKQGGEENTGDTQKGSIATKIFGLLGRKR